MTADRALAALAALLSLGACDTRPAPTAPTATPSAVAGETTEAMRAYAAANDRMHGAMGRIDRDPDVAFVQGMIPHHQGAIDMAETVLKYGKDPENQALAQAIIQAQRAEIAQMKDWLRRHDAAPAAAGNGHTH